jgi:hypothetical protein
MKSPAYPMLRRDVRRFMENNPPEETAPPRLDSSGSWKMSVSSTTLMKRAANATTARYLLRGTKDTVRPSKLESPMSFALP